MASEVPTEIDTSVTAVGPLAEMFAGMNIGNDATAEETSAATTSVPAEVSSATDVTSEQQSQSAKRRADEEGRPTPSESVAGRHGSAARSPVRKVNPTRRTGATGAKASSRSTTPVGERIETEVDDPGTSSRSAEEPATVLPGIAIEFKRDVMKVMDELASELDVMKVKVHALENRLDSPNRVDPLFVQVDQVIAEKCSEAIEAMVTRCKASAERVHQMSEQLTDMTVQLAEATDKLDRALAERPAVAHDIGTPQRTMSTAEDP